MSADIIAHWADLLEQQMKRTHCHPCFFENVERVGQILIDRHESVMLYIASS